MFWMFSRDSFKVSRFLVFRFLETQKPPKTAGNRKLNVQIADGVLSQVRLAMNSLVTASVNPTRGPNFKKSCWERRGTVLILGNCVEYPIPEETPFKLPFFFPWSSIQEAWTGMMSLCS